MEYGFLYKGKSEKKELKLVVSYTGWTLRLESKKEHIVVNKTVCASFDKVKHFKKVKNKIWIGNNKITLLNNG